MRISDWSSDVCSSDLDRGDAFREEAVTVRDSGMDNMRRVAATDLPKGPAGAVDFDEIVQGAATNAKVGGGEAPQLIAFASLSMPPKALRQRSEEHTAELQSLMRNSYAVFCLKKKKNHNT